MDHLLNIAVSNALVAGLLGVAAWLVGLVCRRPAVVHALWLLVLLKLVTPPLVSVPIAWTASTVAPAITAQEWVLPAEPVCAVEPEPVAVAVVPQWAFPPDVEPLPGEEPGAALVEVELPVLPSAPVAAAVPPVPAEVVAPTSTVDRGTALWTLLGGIWFTGSATWLLLVVTRTRRFHRLLRHARPAPPALTAQVASLSAQLGLPHAPATLLVPGAVSPMLWGRPGAARLLVPADLLRLIDDEQRATLLVHELAHLRRRDHWVRLLELLATGLYWWHPVVWAARRGLREAEEQLCDAWVVWALPAAAKSYAIALVETVNFLADAPALVLPPAASGVGQVPMLKRRLTMIMRGSIPRTLSAAGLLGVLGLGALLLPFVPTLAQADPPTPPAPGPRFTIELEEKKVDPAKREQIEKAKEEARKLADEVEKLREQTRQLEKKMFEAHRKLAELGGGEGKMIFLFRDGQPGMPVPPPPVGGVRDVFMPRFEVGPMSEAERQAIKARLEQRAAEMTKGEAEIDQLRKNLETLQRVLKDSDGAKQATDVLRDLIAKREAEMKARSGEIMELKKHLDAVIKAVTAPGPVTRPLPPPDGDRRMQDVERKLNELLREVQSLRQEMNRPGERGGPRDERGNQRNERGPNPPRTGEAPTPPAPPTPPSAPRPPRPDREER